MAKTWKLKSSQEVPFSLSFEERLYTHTHTSVFELNICMSISCHQLNFHLYISRPSRPMDGQGGDGDGRSFKNIEDIVCFKCGEKGHFANRCTKGHLAFISLQQNQKQAGENIGK